MSPRVPSLFHPPLAMPSSTQLVEAAFFTGSIGVYFAIMVYRYVEVKYNMLHAKVGKKGQNIILAVKPSDPVKAMRGSLKGLWNEDAQEYIRKLRQEDVE